MKNSIGLIISLFFTILFIAGAIIVFRQSDVVFVSQIGDFIAGIAATVAFFWLILGYFQQNRELRLQREELRLQRESIDLQKEEIKKIGKYNALQQISKILGLFEKSLSRDDLPEVKRAEDLPFAYLLGLNKYLKARQHFADSDSVIKAQNEWKAIFLVCLNFIQSVVTAIKLYCEATGERAPAHEASDARFVVSCHDLIQRIPFLQQYSTVAYMLASNLVNTEHGRDRMELDLLEALRSINAEFVDQEELMTLRKKVADREAKLKRSNGQSNRDIP